MSANTAMVATWPPTAISRTIVADGKAHVLDFPAKDSAPVLLCLHGLGGSALNYGLIGPLLSPDYRVVALDLLGHGETHASPDGGSPTAQLEWQLRLIEAVLQAVSDRPVVLVGHSLGGILAMIHASRYPETVERLVLLAAPAPSRTRLPVDLKITAKLGLLRAPGVHSLVARKLSGSTPEEVVCQQLAQATPHAPRIDPASVAASIEEARRRSARPDAALAELSQWNAILGVMQLLTRPGAWRRRLQSLRTPTLWLQGEDDPLVNPVDAAAFVAQQADWTLRSRSGAGHLLHLEDPQWTADTISRWLAAAPSPSGAIARVTRGTAHEE